MKKLIVTLLTAGLISASFIQAGPFIRAARRDAKRNLETVKVAVDRVIAEAALENNRNFKQINRKLHKKINFMIRNNLVVSSRDLRRDYYAYAETKLNLYKERCRAKEMAISNALLLETRPVACPITGNCLPTKRAIACEVAEEEIITDKNLF